MVIEGPRRSHLSTGDTFSGMIASCSCSGKRTGLFVYAETVQGFLEPDGGLCPPDSRIDGHSSKEWNSDWV